MVRVENNCANCSTSGYHCIGEMCGKAKGIVYECDRCGNEFGTLYHFEGEELCINCIEGTLDVVE